MSFVITLFVQEGIVMASDSRLTLNTTRKERGKKVVHTAVGLSDSNYKTFLTQNNVGISTFGAADIKGVPIGGYIESFMSDQLSDKTEVNDVPTELLRHFRQFSPPPDAKFIVAGYKSQNGRKEQQVWLVEVVDNQARPVNLPGQQGAHWGGEADILTRLIHHVGVLDQQGNVQKSIPHFQIPWQFLTLQDAIEFGVFAIRSTIDAIRFQPRPKTVGGPIDVLVIKPDEAFWVQRKELHG